MTLAMRKPHYPIVDRVVGQIVGMVVGSMALLALGGCAGMGAKFESPHVTIVGADMVSADMFTQQFRVRVHVDNPNDRALPIKKIDYELFLEGDSFAEGSSLAPFLVPARGEHEFDMTLRTNFVSSVARLLSRINGSDSNVIRYTFVGDVVLDATFSPKLHFSENGTVDLGRR